MSQITKILSVPVDAAKGTKKALAWVVVSAVVGVGVALLADPQVMEVIKSNPKLVAWIPVINIVLVYVKKLVEEIA